MSDERYKVTIDGECPEYWKREEAHLPWEDYERLTAEVERYREALVRIATFEGQNPPIVGCAFDAEIARRALDGEEESE